MVQFRLRKCLANVVLKTFENMSRSKTKACPASQCKPVMGRRIKFCVAGNRWYETSTYVFSECSKDYIQKGPMVWGSDPTGH